MSDRVVLVPLPLIDVLVASGAPWGHLKFTVDNVEGVVIVTGYSAEDGPKYSTAATNLLKSHYMRSGYDTDGWNAIWYRTTDATRNLWRHLSNRSAAVVTEALSTGVQGWKQPPVDTWMPILTIDVIPGEPTTAAVWAAVGGTLQPTNFALVDDDVDRTVDLRPGWPLDELRDTRFTIVGVGSIGSAAADALAGYGARHLTLVDHDRLLPHNLVRHRADRQWLGRKKVRATKDTLISLYPHLDGGIDDRPVNVIEAADEMRQVFADSDVVLCCADGVEARWASSHITWWSRTPIVFGCVLDEGAFGEVIRLRPGPTVGCLRCQRLRMAETGQLDPEPGIDGGYDTGNRHRPMTAVTGDLQLLGTLTAKVAIATVLESKGHPDQRLPADHAIVSLRARIDTAEPFDLPRSGLVRWLEVGGPIVGCPTCDGA